jgi:hypothetical protein
MATGSASGLDHIAVEMPAPQVNEHPARAISGWAMLAVSVVVTLGGLALFWWGIVRAADGTGGGIALIIVGALVTTAGAVLACGLTPVAPGEARVVQLLGRYTGTIRTATGSSPSATTPRRSPACSRRRSGPGWPRRGGA